jgi:hypothetical protein
MKFRYAFFHFDRLSSGMGRSDTVPA